MKVAILGAGPSAAYAMMACEDLDVQYQVISSNFPSMFFPGPFWARLNPTEIAVPETDVHVYSVGNVYEYLKKQWQEVQDEWMTASSFPTEARTEYAYNPYELFIPFWESRRTISLTTGDLTDEDIKNLAVDYDLVFMTFASEESREAMKSYRTRYPIISYKADFQTAPFCIYNGHENEHIVRFSSLFGYVHAEYPQTYSPRLKLLTKDAHVTWVADTIPDTPEWNPYITPAYNVTLLGRFARWDRKVLAHHAYARTKAVLENRL